MSDCLRAVVIDDEPLARRRMRRLLLAIGGTEVAGEAADGRRALEVIRDTTPDIALVDIQLPELDGLALVERLPPPRPVIVFTTAFASFALRAFDVEAADYLLKPVSRERLASALDRVRARLAHRGASTSRASAPLAHVVVRSAGQVRLVDVAAVDWIETANNYVVLHAGAATHILRDTLDSLAKRLDPTRFVRIHRSAVVQLDRISTLQSLSRGDYTVTLTSGKTLPLSRTYRRAFEQAVGSPRRKI